MLDSSEYVDALTEQEKIALAIAREKLGSSFNLEKSIGFKKEAEKKCCEKK